jgi:dihydroxyacetone kinase-like predicted kinase
LIVVGDEATVRIHVHTTDPGDVLHYIASTGGTMHQVSIRNMDEQHRDFLQMQRDNAPEVEMAIVAVAAGDGLREVFQSLGVTAIVPGGQTMNPSTKDILQAIEAAASDKVIVLPNNKNIILAAEQTKELTEKTVEIVAAETIPQGVAALLAFDYEADIATNANIMRQSLPLVKTIEITRAVRTTKLNDIKVKKKQAIGLLEGELVAVGSKPEEVLHEAMAKLDTEHLEIVTIYYGADTDAAKAEKTSAAVRERHPNLQVEVVHGGQPHYEYIVSVE